MIVFFWNLLDAKIVFLLFFDGTVKVSNFRQTLEIEKVIQRLKSACLTLFAFMYLYKEICYLKNFTKKLKVKIGNRNNCVCSIQFLWPFIQCHVQNSWHFTSGLFWICTFFGVTLEMLLLYVSNIKYLQLATRVIPHLMTLCSNDTWQSFPCLIVLKHLFPSNNVFLTLWDNNDTFVSLYDIRGMTVNLFHSSILESD